ncbi:ubiquinol-cytochrome C chaperone family protein [Mangrovicella endophytica]|uniref:ubiquinol-cytochrome C chaperone family protein n=1 Tax=Mangrovicella endophytica TaxID=2066697 RepID=UPI000C9E1EDA|nr:ubiquinol-cytochrome C chaperone family protein [Mangrovicella endophytica]
MFEGFRARRRNRAVVDGLYEAVLERARAPKLFIDLAVPDTVMGRFEALALHVFLVLERCRREPALAPLAQDLVDRFMVDLDASIRELGIGDQSVPKRMRKLAGHFYERVAAYDAALAAGGIESLASALDGRIVEGGDAAERLANYMEAQRADLAHLSTQDLLAGRLRHEA